MSVRDVDGLNVGYAQALLEQYLENPEAVPEEWRSLFESGDAAARRGAPGPRAPVRDAEGGERRPAPAAATAKAPEPAPAPRPRC